MVLRLGTGSKAASAVAEIGALLANGKFSKIVGVPTSKRTYEQALSLGIPLSTHDDHPVTDLAIDGADKQACMRGSNDEFASSDEEPTAALAIPATWPSVIQILADVLDLSRLPYQILVDLFRELGIAMTKPPRHRTHFSELLS